KGAIIVLGAEPELDCANPQAALAGLRAAEFVVQLSPWKTGLEYANAVLPITPFTETSGTFVNIEGRAQSFYATVNPLGEARPAWMNSRLLARLGVAAGQPVAVKQGEGEARLMAALDDKLPDDCVRVSAAHATTAKLGPMFGTVSLEKAVVREAA